MTDLNTFMKLGITELEELSAAEIREGMSQMDLKTLRAWTSKWDAPEKDAPSVMDAVVNADVKQSFYLWQEGNMPGVTEYTVNDGDYCDDPDFRPYITSHPVPAGVTVKGAVVICPGGAFVMRAANIEGEMVARGLAKLGYQCFVVTYRCDPWTQTERGYDLARAIRFVRKNASKYGFDPKNIAVVGFSAGGILCGETLQNCSGLVNGTAIDPTYVPDALDNVSADVAAAGMGYSFYGILAHASVDVEKLAASHLPPTFYFHGSKEVFYDEITKHIKAVEAAGIPAERYILQDQEHGFGGFVTEWFTVFGDFLNKAFVTDC